MKVENHVNEAGDYFDDLPADICNQLNELTGNNWVESSGLRIIP